MTTAAAIPPLSTISLFDCIVLVEAPTQPRSTLSTTLRELAPVLLVAAAPESGGSPALRAVLGERGWRRPLLWCRDPAGLGLLASTWAVAKICQPTDDDEAWRAVIGLCDLTCLPPLHDTGDDDRFFVTASPALTVEDLEPLLSHLRARLTQRARRRTPCSVLTVYDSHHVEADRLDALRLFSRHQICYLDASATTRTALAPPLIDLERFDALLLDGSLDGTRPMASPYRARLGEFGGARIGLAPLRAEHPAVDLAFDRMGVAAIVSGASPDRQSLSFAACAASGVEFVQTRDSYLSDAAQVAAVPLAERGPRIALRASTEPCRACGEGATTALRLARLRRLCALRGLRLEPDRLDACRAVISLQCACRGRATILEAARARTPLVMTDGHGLLTPQQHFLPLRPDLADADEVFDRLRDVVTLRLQVDATCREVVEAAPHGWHEYVDAVDDLVARLVPLSPRRKAVGTVGAAYPGMRPATVSWPLRRVSVRI